MLALTGCGNNDNKDNSTDPDSDIEPTPLPEKGDYGVLENPLTVAEFKEKVVNLVEATNEAFSEHPFFITGYVDANASFDTSYSNFNNMYLHDDVTDDVSLKVQRANKTDTFDGGDKVYKNDKVVIRGYAEYYNKIYSIFPYSGDEEFGKVALLSRTLGTSSVSVTPNDKVTFTPLVSSATNGETLQLTATAETGYLLTVKANGTTVEKVGETYPINVEGDTVVTFEVVRDLTPVNLPSGTYTVTINKSNNGLSTEALTSDADIQFSIAEDTDTVVYKKLNVKFYAGALNHSSYDEFGCNAIGLFLTATTPCGIITKIESKSYYKNYTYYAGTKASGTQLTMSETTADNKTYILTSDMDNAICELDCGRINAYLYYLQFTITVA